MHEGGNMITEAQLSIMKEKIKEDFRKDLEAIERVERMMIAQNASQGSKQDDRQLQLGGQEFEASDEDDVAAETRPTLIGAIEKVINAAPSIRWTTQKVMAQLTANGYKFEAAKPIYSVGQSLQKLVKQQKIRCTHKGSGSTPNIYKGRVEGASPIAAPANQESRSEGGERISLVS
jgi:hypothetical protein